MTKKSQTNRALAVVTENLRVALKHQAANVIKIGSLLSEVREKVGHDGNSDISRG